MMASLRTSATSSGGDFRIGIGHGEDDRLVRHGLHHLLGHRALDRKTEEHVGAFKRVGQAAGVGLDRRTRLPLVHALGTAFVDDTLGVAENKVLVAETDGAEQLKAGDAGGAGAIADQFGFFDLAPGEFQRIDQAGGRDNGRAVLVVVEHRNIEQFTQPLLDDEAFRRLDSSRLMPPQPLPSSLTQLMISSGSSVDTSRSMESISAKRLNRIDLPSITGLAANAPYCRDRGSRCHW